MHFLSIFNSDLFRILTSPAFEIEVINLLKIFTGRGLLKGTPHPKRGYKELLSQTEVKDCRELTPVVQCFNAGTGAVFLSGIILILQIELTMVADIIFIKTLQKSEHIHRSYQKLNLNFFTFLGDGRVNEQIGLTAIHTAWHRYHNSIESKLHHLNPHWNGEKLVSSHL